MRTAIETITPEIAARYLEKNTINRPLRIQRVKRLAGEIRKGHWRLTHQGIAFDRLGNLIDGQHRLRAIVESGMTVQVLVTRDVDVEVMLHVDQGVMRSDRDAFVLAGVECSSREVAIAKCMWRAYCVQEFGSCLTTADSNADRDTLLEFMRANAEAISFANDVSHARGTAMAASLSAVAVAWWYCDRARLAEFQEAMLTGVVANTKTDTAAIRLRDWLLRYPGSGGNQLMGEVFTRSCNALDSFLQRKPLAKLYNKRGCPFRLPKFPGLRPCVELTE